MYYINYFFIMSILGHFLETFFYSSGESGILFGYWTPIYGIGTVIILLIYKCVSKTKYKNLTKTFILFISSAIILSLIEMMGGYLIKELFNKELWDYTNHKLNIGEYTSVEMAFIWGLSSLALVYFIKPIVDKIVSKIPNYLTYIFIILFVIDLITTIIIKI